MTGAFVTACVPAAPRVFTGGGVVPRTASRLASSMGLSRHKPSPSDLPNSWARNDGSKRKKYKGLYDHDTLLLNTVVTAQDGQPSSESLERPQDAHISGTPRILRTIDIRLEEVLEHDNGGAKSDDNLHNGQHQGAIDHQEV
jgi:hypothetical protein